MAAKTKDSALKERDRVHKAYKAVTAKLLSENRERLPAAAAFADWLATDPNPDDRHAAVMMMCHVLIEVDGMADPLPDEPPSTFQELRIATLTKPPKQTQTPKDSAVITLNIATPDDIARLPALLAALMAQFGQVGQVGPAPETNVSRFGPACAPVAVEAPKRARKLKAEMDVAAAPAAVIEESAVDVAEAPEPVEEVAIVVVAPVVVVQPEPAKTYTEKDVLAALQAFAKAPAKGSVKNVDIIKDILGGFGAKNLATIKPEDYAAVIAAVAVPA